VLDSPKPAAHAPQMEQAFEDLFRSAQEFRREADMINSIIMSAVTAPATTSVSDRASKRTHLGISDLVERAPQHDRFEQRAGQCKNKRKADDMSDSSETEEAWLARQDKPTSETIETDALLSASPLPVVEEHPLPVVEERPLPVVEQPVKDMALQVEAHVVVAKDAPALEVSKPDEGRPAKRQRIRHIAERVGYAALGGVTASAVIMGTLIYTAPSFA
jgi:hypothetical protein